MAIGYRVIVSPHENKLERADAVVVLGGAFVDGRYDYGVTLMKEQYAPMLVISHATETEGASHWPCIDPPVAGTTVHCFFPDPDSTQGEARTIRDYAQQYGWKKIIVVTSSYHVSRARMIIERCFGGQVMMTSPPASHSLGRMAYQYVYQTAGYAKAWTVATGC